jgi:hypothetical protein
LDTPTSLVTGSAFLYCIYIHGARVKRDSWLNVVAQFLGAVFVIGACGEVNKIEPGFFALAFPMLAFFTYALMIDRGRYS